MVGVEFHELETKIRPKDHIELVRPLLPVKYSPMQTNGNGLQSVYLAEISEDLADLIVELTGAQYPDSPVAPQTEDDQADEHEQVLIGRTDIGEVERTQLVRARRGQGVFRANVRLTESRCRVTHLSDPAHLHASHIKPWKDSTDEEKLNGCNGLLLSPHVDHLFDRGLISFTDNGDLLLSETSAETCSSAGGYPNV